MFARAYAVTICACMWVHAATINPARNIAAPNAKSRRLLHRRTPPARRTRTDTPAIPSNRKAHRPSARCRSAMPPPSGGMGQIEQPEQGAAPASRYAPSGFASAVSAKLAAGPARQIAARENGDGGRLHRRTAPQAVRHRACTVPPDRRMTKRCPHSCTAAASRNSGSTPLSSAHQSAAMSTRKPSRT